MEVSSRLIAILRILESSGKHVFWTVFVAVAKCRLHLCLNFLFVWNCKLSLLL